VTIAAIEALSGSPIIVELTTVSGPAGPTGPVGPPGTAPRNLLHNSMFNIAQRTGPWTTPSSYTSDRWAIWFQGGALSASRVALADADRAAIGDEAAAFAMQYVVTGGAVTTDVAETFQGIEDVRRLSGKTVALSFWAKAASGTPKLGMSLDQSFGTGGSPSAKVAGVGQSVTLSPTWARYSLTFTLASASGKTLGTNSDSCTYLNVWFSGGAGFNTATGTVGVQSGTFTIWGVQLEIGAAATPLEKPEPRYDLANCQRFYQVGMAQSAFCSSGPVTATILFPFGVTMRAVPTMTANFTTQINGTGSLNAVAGPPNGYGYQLNIVTTAALGVGVNIFGYWTASADL
jgi:hypothetical protein